MKQLTIALVTVVFLGVAVPVTAQNFLGVEAKTAEGMELTVLLNGQLAKSTPVGDSEARVGFYVYGLVDRSWAQAHGGITYSPSKWIGFSAGAGTEVNEHPWRVAGSVFLAGRGNHAFLAVEHGGGDFWYRVHYLREIQDQPESVKYANLYHRLGRVA